MMFFRSCLIFWSCFFQISYAQAEVESFLTTARATNPELSLLKKKLDARLGLSGSGVTSVTTPKVFIESLLSHSKQESQNPLLDAQQTQALSLKVGAQKSYLNGLKLKVGNESSAFRLKNSRYLNVSNFTYTATRDFNIYGQSPFAELELPLWRGIGGTKNRNNAELLSLQEDVGTLELEKLIEDKESDLVNLYWSVALKLEQKKYLNKSMGRVQKIYDFVKRKVNLKIEESGTLYQIQAFIKNNEASLLAIESDLSDLISSLKEEGVEFNEEVFKTNLRQVSKLSKTSELLVSSEFKLKLINRKRESWTLKSKAYEVQPSLDFFAKTSWQSVNTTLGSSFDNYPNSKRPLIVVGVNFLSSINLDFLNNSKNGFLIIDESNSVLAAKDLERELTKKSALEKKLSLAYDAQVVLIDLNNVQLKKLENEQRLLNLGRSSLFQILQYEQDFLRSEEMLYSKILEIKSLETQLSRYRYVAEKVVSSL